MVASSCFCCVGSDDVHVRLCGYGLSFGTGIRHLRGRPGAVPNSTCGTGDCPKAHRCTWLEVLPTSSVSQEALQHGDLRAHHAHTCIWGFVTLPERWLELCL